MNNGKLYVFLPTLFLMLGCNGYLMIILLLVVISVLCMIIYRMYTDKLSTQKEVRRSQTLNGQLLDISFINTVILDAKGTILQFNESCMKELNLDIDEVEGKPVIDVLDIRLSNQSLLQSILERLQGGERKIELPADCVIYNLHNGSHLILQGTFIGTYQGSNLINIIFIFRNIEGELTQEFILNMALSKTKIFPWFFDMESNKMIIDMRWFNHLGYPEGDGTLLAEEFAALVHPDDRDELLGALGEQLKGNLIKDTFTYRLLRKDGTWEWFEEQSVYLGSENGIPYRIVGVCQSIHEHKIIEKKLIEARNKAEESDQLKSAFLANMSHEIRTPLNAIVGFSSFLCNAYSELSVEEVQEYTSMIEKNSQLLTLLISDILDLSKIESNTMEFRIQPCSLNSLMTDISKMQKMNVKDGIELVVDIPEKDVILMTDSQRLGQVMNNLINNAIKFTSEGSIHFGYRQENDNMVSLFVKDSGIGMSEQVLAHIFERFYKGDIFVQGTGLGLAITKIIVEQFNGKIDVISKEGEGTCFTVSLPLNQGELNELL